MSEFARTRAMRQFYRNLFTRLIDLPEADVMPAHIVAEIFSFKSANLALLDPMIRDAKTGLDAEKEDALKNLLRAIVLANHVFDDAHSDENPAFPADLTAQITEYVVSALQVDSNVNYLVAAIQILFRVNEISSALFLINNHLSTVSQSAPVLKILLLVCLMEDDYNQAMVVIQALTAEASLIGEDPMALLMITCGIFKLGGLPDSYIDFRSLDDSESEIADPGYDVWIEKTSNAKTTVLLSCDERDYYTHAVPLVYSIHATNHDELDVHLHLYNCGDDVKQNLLALREQLPELHISASHEHINSRDALTVIYASRRMILLRHALQTFATPIIAMNTNMLIRHRWKPLDTPLLLLQSETSPFWEEVFAGFIYAQPDEVTQRYFDKVARFIDVNLSSGNHVPGLEQVALFACLDRLSGTDQMAILRKERTSILDSHDGTEAFCWVGGNTDSSYQTCKASLLEQYPR
jgi:hypothetical protein